ncbi:MAG: GNAT family N-acetyltransferase [Chitinophagales bacterium]|nr:GNAT family N-acetyltransferase [Chitinophagales bacterium]
MLQPVFLPFPELMTPRLRLRFIVPEDAESLLFLRSSEDVMHYIDKERMKTREDALALIQKMTDGIHSGTGINWGISLLDDPALLGTIAFWRLIPENYRAEIGYMLHPDFQGRGLMSEAMTEVIRYGFEVMNLHSIEANINPGNEVSRKLLLKFRFQKEAYFRENYFFNGKFLDSEIYSLIRT